MVKSTYIDRNGVRRGAWTKEEDHKLRAYVERFGHSNWRLLPKFAGLDRCGKSCRLRWMNYLKPGLERGGYTQQERDLIAKLHHLHGNKWSVMAAELPGRTDQGIKNYWHAHHKNRKNTTSKSFAGEEGETSELSNVDTTASPKLGSPKHIRTRASTSQVVVLESSEFNSTAVPTVVELGSDDSTEQSCSNGSSITSMATHDGDNLSDLLVSKFHDNFWTQLFMLETDSYQGYHDYDFSVFDEGGVFPPVYRTL